MEALHRRVAWGMLCMLLAASPLHGQAEHALESLNRYAGKVVVVHDLAGLRVSGRLIGATSVELTVLVDGTRRGVGVAEIASVGVVGDPIWDGVLKGLGVGALLTLLGNADVSGCDQPCLRDSALSNVLGVAVVGAIGGWIDARHTRERLVYEKP